MIFGINALGIKSLIKPAKHPVAPCSDGTSVIFMALF